MPRLYGRRPGQDEEESDPIQLLSDPEAPDPYTGTKTGEAIKRLETILRELTLRQQQTFLLRAWEGLSVSETASVMGGSEGTVKTHYSRAVNTLKENLRDTWP